jgi:hypothetical protein
MKQKTVTIEIDEQGNSSIDLVGFQGKGCADVAKMFEGTDAVMKSEKKREFHIGATAEETVRRRN